MLIEPTNACIIQQSFGEAFYGQLLSTQPCYWTLVSNKSFCSFYLAINPGDMFIHHAIALGLHVTVLILLKGGLGVTRL
jgi:photosystem I P700 chlorophyll a apoprotein A2